MYPYSGSGGAYSVLVDGGAGAPSFYSSPGTPNFTASQGSFCSSANGSCYVNTSGSAGGTTWTLLASGTGVVLAVAASSPLASTGGASPSISIASPIPIALGGNGTATPAIGAGSNIQTSGSWPQTVATIPSPSFTSLILAAPLPIASGGTGATAPGIVAGSNITLSGAWPNQTINASGALGVGSVTASGNLASSGGTSPNITLSATPSFTSVSTTGNITAAGDISTATYYNIKTYGASTGATAATNNTAIAAALAAAAGKGTVIIPAGTFNVSATFQILSNTSVCLIGELSIANGANNGIFGIGSAVTNVWIYGGGTLNLNGGNQTSVNAYGISILLASSVLIENISVINSYYFPISPVACTNVIIRNVTINNFFTGSGLWGAGLGFSGSGGVPCTNCWVEDCHIYNTHDEAISFYNGCVDCGARGNYISGAVYGIGLLTDTTGNPESNGIIIENNTVTGCTFAAIFTLINGVSLYHKNIQILSNHVYANTANSLFLTDCSDVLVSDNICHNNTNGMYIDNVHGIGFINITNNMEYNEGTSANGYGVHFNSAVANVSITNNLWYDTRAGGARQMAVGIDGSAGAALSQFGNAFRNLTNWGTGIDQVEADTVYSSAGAFGAAYGVCPPVVPYAGTSEHIARGAATISITAGSTQGFVVVSLSGQKAFASVSSYQVFANYDGSGSSPPAGWSNVVSVTSFRNSGTSVSLYASSTAAASGTGSLIINYMCIGT
jgi:hypothetical protein